jgi:uncharacterized protein YqeY
MASALIDRILDDIKVAMKAREKDKLAALRLLNSEIKNVAINERRGVTDDDALTVIARLIKQRQEAIEQFTKGGRDDLVAKETFELETYRAYQPEQLTAEAIATLVDQVITATNASGKKDIGKVMQAVMPEVKGRADGKVVNAIVSEKLG